MKIQLRHYVRGQWVFGVIERGNGRTFLVCTEKNLSLSLFITNHHGLALDRTWGLRGAQTNAYIRTFTRKHPFY